MNFARWVYRVAGIYGLIALVPAYFLEARIGRDFPPAITHPECYYGFLGVAVAWQVLFVIMSRDPIRYRPIMPASVLEKFGFGLAAVALFVGGRIPAAMLAVGCIDLTLGVLFIVAYGKTPAERS